MSHLIQPIFITAIDQDNLDVGTLACMRANNVNHPGYLKATFFYFTFKYPIAANGFELSMAVSCGTTLTCTCTTRNKKNLRYGMIYKAYVDEVETINRLHPGGDADPPVGLNNNKDNEVHSEDLTVSVTGGPCGTVVRYNIAPYMFDSDDYDLEIGFALTALT